MGMFSKKSYIGVDMGHHTIKVIQFEKQANGWRVQRVAQTMTPPDAIKDGVVVDVASLSARLKAMCKENNIPTPAAR